MRGSLVVGTGSLEAATGTITYVFELARGERTMRWRESHQLTDANTKLFRSIFELAPGQDHEVVRATYRRRG